MVEGYLISEAAKEVQVESHVLRYWEEELKLPISRNELGHRYYTRENIEQFKRIKDMKEKGLQLKAIKVIMKREQEKPELTVSGAPVKQMQISTEEKLKRLQGLLESVMREAVIASVRDTVGECMREQKESIIKELDYQFRSLEEREDKRDQDQAERNEAYYKRIDEVLRGKSRRKGILFFRGKHS